MPVYFTGNAPSVAEASDFWGSFSTSSTLYYLEGTTGWTDSEYYDEFAGTWNGYTLEKWEQSTEQPGDLDGNEGIDTNDAIYLLYHAYFPSKYPVNQNCDFNGDGKVDQNDAIYLLYHAYFPTRYPLK